MADTVNARDLILNSLKARQGEGTFLTATRSQAAIVVVDTSGSMHGAKIDEAAVAFAELKRELQRPENKGAFEVAVVEYGSTAEVTMETRSATDVPEETRFSVGRFGGGTNIAAGLEAARHVATTALARDKKQLRPVVVLLTDGQHTGGGDPVAAASRLKECCDVACVAFGADADTSSLTRLASRPDLVTRAQKGPELRHFFAQVGSSMRLASQRGTSFAAELGSKLRDA